MCFKYLSTFYDNRISQFLFNFVCDLICQQIIKYPPFMYQNETLFETLYFE